MLISGVIASTLLIGAMAIAILIGLILIPYERKRADHRKHS